MTITITIAINLTISIYVRVSFAVIIAPSLIINISISCHPFIIIGISIGITVSRILFGLWSFKKHQDNASHTKLGNQLHILILADFLQARGGGVLCTPIPHFVLETKAILGRTVLAKSSQNLVLIISRSLQLSLRRFLTLLQLFWLFFLLKLFCYCDFL